jgi:hypothetical protein
MAMALQKAKVPFIRAYYAANGCDVKIIGASHVVYRANGKWVDGGWLNNYEIDENGKVTPPVVMTADQFSAALKRLDLRPASQETARVLGVSVRHIVRLAGGKQSISEQTRLLLDMYKWHGIPKELRDE